MLLAQMKAALGSLDRVERIVKLGVFVNSAPVVHRPAQGRQWRFRADAGRVRRGRPPRPQRGRSRGSAARRRGRGRRDRRGEGLVHLGRLTQLTGMADRESEIIAKIASGVAAVDAAQWDALAGGDPFLSHAFLSALEDSGSVGPGTGWTPAPILVEDEATRLVAAAPAYLKTHSQGEYVFDHGWAEAWQRAGGNIIPSCRSRCRSRRCPGPRLLGQPPAAIARRRRGGDRAERPVVGAHHLHRRGRRARVRAARLADPPRHPISLVQPRLCELRRFPRRA